MKNNTIKIDIDIGLKYNLSLQELAIYDYILKKKDWTYESIINDNPLLNITNKKTVYKKIQKLKDLKLISFTKLSDKQVYDILNKSDSKTGCLFCGYNRCSLDKHHYPIRAKDGGIDTINLCPNCHREFHELADYSNRARLIV